MNEISNGCVYLVLDWLDIFFVVCDTWCGLFKISLIFWYEATSYLQFPSSAIIVSKVVDYNLVLNHNSGYLVQMQLCCRWYNPKMGYLISLTGWVGGPMVSNYSGSFIIHKFLFFLLTFFYPWSSSWVLLTLICKL